MKIIFFSSENARFLLGLEGRDIFLMKENREIWKRKIKYTNFEVLGVGNNGNVFLKAEEGIIQYPIDATSMEKLLPWLDYNSLENEGTSIVKAVMDKSGDRLCIQKMSMKSKFSEKLFKILSSSPKMEKGQALHELLFYEVQSARQTVFHKFVIDRKIPHAFTWSVSKDFRYVIMAEAQKVFKGTETKFSIASVTENSILDQFVLEGLTEWILMINCNGAYLIDSPQKREPRELLVGTPRSHTFKLTISNEYRAEHLGRDFVAFQSRMEPREVFKRYDNSVLQEIDLTPLKELKLDFQIVFTDSDDIILVTRRDGEVKLVHSNRDSIAIDARRWQMMSEQRKIDTEIDQKKTVLEEKQKNLKDKKAKLKSEELSKTALEHRHLRSRQEDTVKPKPKDSGELQFIFGSGSSATDELEYRKKLEEKEMETLKRIQQLSTPDKTRVIDSFPTSSLEPPVPSQIPKTSERKPSLISFETVEFDDEPPSWEDRSKKKKKLPENFQDAKTRIISLEDELQRYIPSMEIEVDQAALEAPEPTMTEISLPNLRKAPPRKKKMPERLSFEISPKNQDDNDSGFKPEPEPETITSVVKIDFSPKEKKRNYETGIMREIPEAARKKTPEKKAAAKEDDFDMSGFDASEYAPLQTDSSWDLNDKDEELLSSAFSDSGYDFGTPSPVVETTKDDDARLAEIKRQIEREIQEAVMKKKTDTSHGGDQKKKYVQLLEELEESFINGGISEESYYRLRAKYEERIEEIEKNGRK